MATITFELATDITLDNITVTRKFVDGVLSAYRLTANEGYVMYDTSEDYTHIDEEGNAYEEIQYFRQVTVPKSLAVSDWTYVAVPEADVPTDQIFGIVVPPTETI